MLEFDPVNSFHLHGNMFEYYPSGTAMNPSYKTDILTLGQGDRGIIEFTYPNAGMFMFHSHKNEFTNLGWMGMFNVQDKSSATTTNIASSSMPSMHSMGQQMKTERPDPHLSDNTISTPPFPFMG
jgi:hypothetical protein